jgi:hypothetical protein
MRRDVLYIADNTPVLFAPPNVGLISYNNRRYSLTWRARLAGVFAMITMFTTGCGHQDAPTPVTVTSTLTTSPTVITFTRAPQTESPTSTAAPGPTWWVDPPTSSGIGKG